MRRCNEEYDGSDTGYCNTLTLTHAEVVTVPKSDSGDFGDCVALQLSRSLCTFLALFAALVCEEPTSSLYYYRYIASFPPRAMRSVLLLLLAGLLAEAVPLMTRSGNEEDVRMRRAASIGTGSGDSSFTLPVRQKSVGSRHGDQSKRALARRQSGDTATPLDNLDDARWAHDLQRRMQQGSDRNDVVDTSSTSRWLASSSR